MTYKTKPLSASAYAVLTFVAERADHLVRLPRLPIAAARQVIRSILNAGLVEELPAPIDDVDHVWCTDQDGRVLTLRATELGWARVAEDSSLAIGRYRSEPLTMPLLTQNFRPESAQSTYRVRLSHPQRLCDPVPSNQLRRLSVVGRRMG